MYKYTKPISSNYTNLPCPRYIASHRLPNLEKYFYYWTMNKLALSTYYLKEQNVIFKASEFEQL